MWSKQKKRNFGCAFFDLTPLIQQLLLLICLALSGCAPPNVMQRVHHASHRLETQPPADGLVRHHELMNAHYPQWVVVDKPSKPTPNSPNTWRLFIEGDGLSWLGSHRVSGDPTPAHPVGLALFLANKSDKKPQIYLGRACQYVAGIQGTLPSQCTPAQWTTHIYTQDKVDSAHQILDQLKARHDIQSFEVWGYSGGGWLASLLAATRHDVVSLHTVAGNLSPKTFVNVHKLSPYVAAIEPCEYSKLSQIPQQHFVGEQDTIVPDAVINAYLNGLGLTHASMHLMPAKHTGPWTPLFQ